MPPEQVGWVGGIAGSVVGILGGVVGTYFCVRNTDGPRERAFVIRLALALWFWITASLGAAFALPRGWQFVGILVGQIPTLFIPRFNAIQQQIRREEHAERTGDPGPT